MGVGLWWRGWMQRLLPTRPLTQHSGEGKILIRLCSGFDGFWLGSTPCLASDAAQDGQDRLTVKQIQTDSHQLVLKPLQEFAFAAASPQSFIHPSTYRVL